MAPTSTTKRTVAFAGRALSPGAAIGLLQLVARRLWSNIALMLAIAAGFVAAITLTVSIPVYAEAVGFRILRDELAKGEEGVRRPPFAFMYRYIGSQSGDITLNDYDRLDTYMSGDVDGSLGLPVGERSRYVATTKFPLFADGSAKPLMYFNLSFASNFADHITIVDGAYPVASAEGPVEVLLAEETADRLGVQVGEEYRIINQKRELGELVMPVRIAGIWRAIDPAAEYWFYRPDTLKENLFMSEQVFEERVASRLIKPVSVALWYLVTDGSGIRSNMVPDVLGRITRTGNSIGSLLAGTRLDISPRDALVAHQSQVQRLTLVLSIFSVPILGLIGYFILLIAGLVVQRQSNEIAVLRSRGATRVQILGIYLVEWLLLGLATLGIGLVLGQVAASVMTRTRSFLTLTTAETLPIVLTPDAWQRAWWMFALLAPAILIPAFGVARHTIVSFKSERARNARKPFWQRFYLDVLLLIPAWYGYSLLQQRGTIAFLGGAAGDPFGNPLLLLAPSLFVVALALITVRIFPLPAALLARLANHMPGVSLVTALRYLSRTPNSYGGPVLLLVLTLSLATFTASMARTLDAHLFDQSYYDNGSDYRVYDLGQSLTAGGPPGGGQATTPPATDPTEPRFLFLPVTDYLQIDGVERAARVSTTAVEVIGGSGRTAVQFVGVDRAEIPALTRWRVDYARESLGALMNNLADDPANMIVSEDLASQLGLRIGDKITVAMSDLDVRKDVLGVVVGFVRLFPTVYPSDGPFIIGNLEYAFEQQGGMYPYDVWMSLREGTTIEQVRAGILDLGLATYERAFVPDDIRAERLRPERQGFYGLLSVGFIAAAFLTLLGFLFYSVLSFQRRYVEFGMLRAIGLSSGQLGMLLTIEQTLIIGTGTIAGTLIGVAASNLFIPFLQVARGENALIPPFLVRIAWNEIGIIYAVFGTMLVLAVGVTLLLLRRMRLFQAVKLGEAI